MNGTSFPEFEPDHTATPVSLSLHIERGRTQFPDRPLDVSPFLIGKGRDCHLQLGGDLPPVHSCITVAAGIVTIQCLAAEPPLKVNRAIIDRATLSPGAMIEIGPFQFRLLAPVAPESLGVIEPLMPAEASASVSHATIHDSASDSEGATAPPQFSALSLKPESSEEVPGVDELSDDPVDLAVHDLVDRLETALERLESMEQRRRAGLAALLDRVFEVAGDETRGTVHRRSA